MRRDCLPPGFHIGLLPPRSLISSTELDYETNLHHIQRFRAAVYIEDQAIPADAVGEDNRHVLPGDESQWHVFMTDGHGQVCACLRLAAHHGPNGVRLHGYQFLVRMNRENRTRYANALNAWTSRALYEEVGIGEVGGWAVGASARRSTTTMFLPLAAWSVYQILGNCLVLSTATVRHRSADILKKLGGFPLMGEGGPLPSFYDAYHRCDIEFVVYDSRRP